MYVDYLCVFFSVLLARWLYHLLCTQGASALNFALRKFIIYEQLDTTCQLCAEVRSVSMGAGSGGRGNASPSRETNEDVPQKL